MTDAPRLPDGYEFSADPARIDVDRTHRWLSTDAYWALDRPREQHERAVAKSLNFGVYEAASGAQVAYARVVTDEALFAWLCDVYVDRQARGKGIGTALVGAVREHLAPLGCAASCSPRRTRTASTPSTVSSRSTGRTSGWCSGSTARAGAHVKVSTPLVTPE